MTKKKTTEKTISLSDAIKIMYELLRPYIDPTDSLAACCIRRELQNAGYHVTTDELKP